MSIRRWAGIGVAGIALAVLSGVITARAMRPESLSEVTAEVTLPALYIADDKQDLGEVWESSDAVLTVPISNRTDKPIEILDFESSCDCGEISPRQLTIPANGTANVMVKMDLTRRTQQQMGMVRRKLEIGMKVVVANSATGQSLQLHGIIITAVAGDWKPILFDDWCVKDGDAITRKIKCDLCCRNSTIICQCHNPRIKVLCVAQSESQIHIHVTPDPAGSAGSFQGDVTIVCILEDGTRILAARVNVNGTMIIQ
jgi:hypothetical protein